MNFFQYRVECLENELIEAKNTIEDQKGQVLVKRSDEDIAKIEEQENVIDNLQQEVSYVKKELIEARAHKSASDDKLSTVQDKIETLQNNINSLTDEGKLKSLKKNRQNTMVFLIFDNFEFAKKCENCFCFP